MEIYENVAHTRGVGLGTYSISTQFGTRPRYCDVKMSFAGIEEKAKYSHARKVRDEFGCVIGGHCVQVTSTGVLWCGTSEEFYTRIKYSHGSSYLRSVCAVSCTHNDSRPKSCVRLPLGWKNHPRQCGLLTSAEVRQ